MRPGLKEIICTAVTVLPVLGAASDGRAPVTIASPYWRRATAVAAGCGVGRGGSARPLEPLSPVELPRRFMLRLRGRRRPLGLPIERDHRHGIAAAAGDAARAGPMMGRAYTRRRHGARLALLAHVELPHCRGCMIAPRRRVIAAAAELLPSSRCAKCAQASATLMFRLRRAPRPAAAACRGPVAHLQLDIASTPTPPRTLRHRRCRRHCASS